MRALRATAVAVLSVAALCGACAPATTGAADYAPELYPGEGAPPTVRVTNNNWSTMTVYAVRGTSRFRLGMVTSMGQEVFRLPASLLSPAGGLRLLADAFGGDETFLTEAITVSEGERVELDLQNHLAVSSVSIFGRH